MSKMNSTATLSKMESAGVWMYEKINNSRLIIGVCAMVLLTAISMRLNYVQGSWTANDPESQMLLPAGYATLDASLIFFLAMLVIGISSKVIRFMTIIWCVVLVSLSLWSSFSFTVAVDERGSENAIKDRIEQLKDNLVTEKKTVGTWQDKLSKTSWLSSKHGASLNNAESKRDATQNEINSLNISKHTPQDWHIEPFIIMSAISPISHLLLSIMLFMIIESFGSMPSDSILAAFAATIFAAFGDKYATYLTFLSAIFSPYLRDLLQLLQCSRV